MSLAFLNTYVRWTQPFRGGRFMLVAWTALWALGCSSPPVITEESLLEQEMDLGLSTEEMADFEEMDVSALISESELLDVYAVDELAQTEERASQQPIDFVRLEQEQPLPSELIDEDVFVIYFSFNSDKLSPLNRDALAEQVDLLRINQTPTTLNGHTDERGSKEYNLALSERRAKAVSDYFIQAGLPASLFTIVAYGEEAPFSIGSGEQHWRLNRRVEMITSR